MSLGVSRAHILSDEERRVVAYHEAGHALVARSLASGRVPHKISIIPAGRSLGQAWVRDTHDRLIHSRSFLVEEMAILLGGRVAEELEFGQPGSGGADDLARVGDIARWMVHELGMSDLLGPLTYADGAGGGNGHATPYSDETARVIEAEARALIEEAVERARAVLEASRESLERLSGALLERETLTSDEIERIAGSSAPMT